jgi:hypothetical protein
MPVKHVFLAPKGAETPMLYGEGLNFPNGACSEPRTYTRRKIIVLLFFQYKKKHILFLKNGRETVQDKRKLRVKKKEQFCNKLHCYMYLRWLA